MIDIRTLRLALTPGRKAWFRRPGRECLAAVIVTILASVVIQAPLIVRAVRFLASAFTLKP